MPFDEQVASRIRKLLANKYSEEFAEKKMFGGLAFMLNEGTQPGKPTQARVRASSRATIQEERWSSPLGRPFSIRLRLQMTLNAVPQKLVHQRLIRNTLGLP